MCWSRDSLSLPYLKCLFTNLNALPAWLMDFCCVLAAGILELCHRCMQYSQGYDNVMKLIARPINLPVGAVLMS